MLKQLIWGVIIITFTVLIHAVVQQKLIGLLEKIAPILSKLAGENWKIGVILIAVLGTLFTLILEMWIWALFLYATNEPGLHSIETALYFSASTFSTLGFGDIVLSPEWRLADTFEATNGLLLFGWSTAFLFEIISNVYRNEKIIEK